MVCLVKVSYVQEKTTKEGGSGVLSGSVILTPKEFEDSKDVLLAGRTVTIDKTNDVHEYMLWNKEFDQKFLDQLSEKSPDEIMQKIQELGNPLDKKGTPLSNAFASNKSYNFTFDEIVQLRNPSDNEDVSLALRVALNGGEFSIDEILKLGNPRNESYINTIGHAMIVRGHKFSVEEIIRLGNPVNAQGDTLAHMMAMMGSVFNGEEIKQLGNPRNENGKSIFDIMKMTSE